LALHPDLRLVEIPKSLFRQATGFLDALSARTTGTGCSCGRLSQPNRVAILRGCIQKFPDWVDENI